MNININDIENEKIDLLIEKEKQIIIEFYTKWCPTCKMVAMNLEEYEEEHPDVFILRIDAEEHKELANIYKVTTAPTLIFFYQGELKKIHHGFIDSDELDEIIQMISEEK